MTKAELEHLDKLRSLSPREQGALLIGLLCGVLLAAALAPRVEEAVRRRRRRREAHQAPYLRLLPASTDSVKTPSDPDVAE